MTIESRHGLLCAVKTSQLQSSDRMHAVKSPVVQKKAKRMALACAIFVKLTGLATCHRDRVA